MTATKPNAIYEGPDLSQQSTREVDAMSSLAAEMLLQDADATSPGIPALSVDRALAAEEERAAQARAGRIEMARPAEVRRSVPPAFPRATSPAEESAMLRALRPRGPRVVIAVSLLVLAALLAAGAYYFSR